VLHAHSSGDLADVVRRRFAGSFSTLKKPGWALAFALAAAAVIWLAVARERLLGAAPRELRAGLIGAWFAVVVGAASNDSGPVILIVGALLLLLGAAYAGCFPQNLRRTDAPATLRGCA
jgi:hypothetical protein